MKGILVLVMVLSHVYNFFPKIKLTNALSVYANLTTFSGFMFCFGYVCYISYINRNLDKNTFRRKMLSNFFKTLIAYYISGLAYLFLIDNNFCIKEAVKILLFVNVRGYNEFLLSFAFIYLILFIFKDNFRKLDNKKLLLLSLVSLLLTFTNIPKINYGLIGVFYSMSGFSCFPIVQYFSLFLFGMYFAKNNINFNKKIFSISLIGTISFILYYIITNNFPSEFYPSIFWVCGNYLIIYVYYLSSKYIYNKLSNNKILYFISKIGANTLSYLVLSNLIIFTATKLNITKNFNFPLGIVLFIICIFSSYIYNLIKNKIISSRKNKKLLI